MVPETTLYEDDDYRVTLDPNTDEIRLYERIVPSDDYIIMSIISDCSYILEEILVRLNARV